MNVWKNKTILAAISAIVLLIGGCGKQQLSSQQSDNSSTTLQSSREEPESEVAKDKTAPPEFRDKGPFAPAKSTPEDTQSHAAQSNAESIIPKKDEPPLIATKEQKDVTPEEVSSHSVLYQEGIDVIVAEDQDGRSEIERIAVFGVAGLRFPVRTLEVDHRARLSTTVIIIEDAAGGFLIPQAGSAVPVNMGFDESEKCGLSFFTHAVNAKWKFAKAGIRFRAGDRIYETERAGASILFTEDGVKIDGIGNVASK